MNALSLSFEYGERQVRVVGTKEVPLFVASDVCRALGLDNSTAALERLDPDEKGFTAVKTLGGPQKMLVVTEPGLYRLVMTSRKDEAKYFQRWVTHKVLPAIHATGHFEDTAGVLSQNAARQLLPVEEAERTVSFVERTAAALNALGGADAKDQFGLRDLLSVATTRLRRCLTGHPGVPADVADDCEPRSVVEVLESRGVIPGQVNAAAVGKRAKKLFVARHWAPPPTMLQRIGGRPTRVSVFPPADMDLVHAALDAYLAERTAKQLAAGRKAPEQIELPGGAR